MFVENKYYIWYHSIIDKAKSQQRFKGVQNYYEKHHIIPKCMNGSDIDCNLVLLTPKEHFICHLLLIKFVDEIYRYKMGLAIKIMITGNKVKDKRIFTSSQYELARKSIINLMRLPRSKETIQKCIATRKANNKPVSQETREKMSLKRKNRIHISNVEKEKTKIIHLKDFNEYENQGWVKGRLFGIYKGKKHTDEQKQKWSKERKGSIQPKISEKKKGMVQAIDLEGIFHYVTKEEFQRRNDLYGVRNNLVRHLIPNKII